VRGRRSRTILAPAIAAALACTAFALAGCGGGDDDSAEPAASVPPTFIQTARSGSFFGGNGAKQTLVLRGVGGAAAFGAEGSGAGGSAGAIATAVLVRRAHQLLGPEPLQATLSGAEVIPQRYELELEHPRYDGVRQELSFDARIVDGSPELAPPSFGAATLTIGSSLPGYELTGSVDSLEPGLEQQQGEPLADALITVSLDGLGLVTATSDADGNFSVGPLPAGSYEVEASKRGYRLDREERTLPPGSDALELELKAEEQVAQEG